MKIKEIKNEGVSKMRKIKKSLAKTFAAVISAGVIASSTIIGVYAEGEAAGGNTGTDPGGFAKDMLGYAWWAIIAICGIFAAMGLIRLVQGQSEEDTRARNNGLVTLVISGLAIVVILLIKTKTT